MWGVTGCGGQVFPFARSTLPLFNVFAQGGVDACLIFSALIPELLPQVGVEVQRDLPFLRTVKATADGPGKVGNLRGIDFFLAQFERDPKACAEAISSLLENPERGNWGVIGRQYVAARFTGMAVAERMEGV